MVVVKSENPSRVKKFKLILYFMSPGPNLSRVFRVPDRVGVESSWKVRRGSALSCPLRRRSCHILSFEQARALSGLQHGAYTDVRAHKRIAYGHNAEPRTSQNGKYVPYF